MESNFTYDNDSYLPDIFGETDIAMEALDDDVDNLGKVDGTQEETKKKKDTTDDTAADDNTDEEAPADDGGDNADDGGPDDLAAATDQQLEEDNQEADPTNDDPDAAAGDTDLTDTDIDTTAEDNSPLKSLEIKEAYKKKFVNLYNMISDSILTMEAFIPDYTSEVAEKYYSLKASLSELNGLITTICTERISAMTVDEVLRKYTLCNMTFDAITNSLKEFTIDYNRERLKHDKADSISRTASKLKSKITPTRFNQAKTTK